MTDDINVWADKLQGMSVVDMRKLMQEEKIKARPSNPQSCVLAEFLYKKTGRIVSVSLKEENGKVFAIATDDINAYVRDLNPSRVIELGHNAGTLARAFDNGQYPELESYE